MRGIMLASASLILMAIGGPASAQRSDEIICELTGDCEKFEVAEDQLLDAGEQAGFSFTRPGSKPSATAGAAKSGVRSASVDVSRPAPRYGKPKAGNGGKAVVVRPARGSAEMRVNFALGSAQVLPDSQEEITAFATALQSPALAGKRFRVEGHTDATGAPERNAALSQERAEAVAAALKAQGIDASRIETKGYGQEKPLPGQGRLSAQNRRVELVPIG